MYKYTKKEILHTFNNNFLKIKLKKGKIMRKKMFKGSLLIHLLIISTLLFLINTSISIFWLSRSNINIDSTISIKKSPNLSWEIAWGTESKPISNLSNNQELPQISSDGAGGAIIVWADSRGSDVDIYAQRIVSNGDVEWTNNGRVVSAETNDQWDPQIISDGAGGAIIVWEDYRSGGANWDIYTQRINSVGDTQWTSTGNSISIASLNQLNPQIISDGAGGAIIVWEDERGGGFISDIYAQRINSNGDVQWTINGNVICGATSNQRRIQICSDGAGGAIIVWQDERGTDIDIYAQRVDSTGNTMWLLDGVGICTASNDQRNPQIIRDGAGGAIITWQDFRSASNTDIYAQRINLTGNITWSPDGIGICTASDDQRNPQIISDGSTGAIITWVDERGTDRDIYAQGVNSAGNIQWTLNGIGICTVSEDQQNPQIISDGSTGAIIMWDDRRRTNSDIYAQRINLVGNVQWEANGNAICIIDGSQVNPQACSDGTGGAIITWEDYRSLSDLDIYAQRIKNDLPTSTHPEDIVTSTDGSETINWTLYDDSAGGKYRVLANDTNGNYYTWRNWTSWANNTSLNVPINLTTLGFFEYTIEYYDDQNQFGIPDTVIVEIAGLEINGYNILILLASTFTIIVILKRKIKQNRIRLKNN